MPDGMPSGPASDSFGFDLAEGAWLSRLRRALEPATLGRLGDYQLLGELGRGAQGVVYKAVQPRTQRTVALKRLAAGSLATPQMRARFEREVGAACLLSHPGIVTVHGVEMLDGQPVLAMEWIEGQPIDAWAEGKPLDEILAVFIQACEAVTHAHRRGVLHRDLKPSNVMVDPQGRARVLDFGLAKLLPGSTAWEETSLTHPGGLVGTPAYLAPEVLSDPESADTRSDVYALGIILYKLLTGRLPFETTGGVARLFDRVRAGVLAPPSAHRPEVGPELDAIALKATSLEPQRRYSSSEELAADIARYRAGEAVLAHPPGRLYELRKLARRHRAAAVGVLAVFVLTAALAVVTTTAAVRLSRKEASLRTALDNEHQALIDATTAKAAEVKAREAAEAAADIARTALTRARHEGQRHAAATDALQRLLAGDFRGVDDADAPEDQPASDPARALIARRELILALRRLGLYEDSLEQAEAGSDFSATSLDPHSRQAALALSLRGGARALMGRLADAEADLRQALAIRDAIAGEATGVGAASDGQDLAIVLLAQGRAAEAEGLLRALLEKNLELGRRPVIPRASLYRDLGAAQLDQGKLDDAEANLQKATELLQQRGEHGEASLLTRQYHGRLMLARAALPEAETDLRAAVAEWNEALGEDHPMSARAAAYLAGVLARAGKSEESLSTAQSAIARLEARLPASHPWLTAARLKLASALTGAGRAEEAATLLRTAAELAEQAPPGTEESLVEASAALARALRAAGHGSDAAACLDHARQVLRQRLPTDSPLIEICERALTSASP